MILKRLTASYPYIEYLQNQRLVKKTTLKNLRCKKCGEQHNIEEFETQEEFWICPRCAKGNKLNDKSVITKTYYIIKPRLIRKKIKEKLGNAGYIVEEKFNEIVIRFKEGYLPVIILEFNQSAAIISEAIKKTSILIYFKEEEIKSVKNLYNKNDFINVCNFLKMDKKALKDFIDIKRKNVKPWGIFKIMSKIKKFSEENGWYEFEKETTNLFNSLKLKEEKIKEMLAFLERNKSNPSGTKYIHIGGNYPVDIDIIQIYDYLRQLLEVSERKGIDTKMYLQRLDYGSYQKKVLSNTGRQLIFITTAEKISGSIWKDLIKAKQRNSNKWWNFVVDLDLLSFIIYFLGEESYYN